MRPLYLLAAAALLSACGEPVTRTSSVTTEGAQPSVSAADIQELDADGLVARIVGDLERLSEQIADPRDADELRSDLMRVEEAGTDYRTVAMRFERMLRDGDAAAEQALGANRARLASARDTMDRRAQVLIAQYPELETDIRETMDKFDFGFLAGNSAADEDR
ncbi:MAG: hypothetical protein WBF53_02555 [Litorimonas sp.]